jgi:ectoine hydroxylase
VTLELTTQQLAEFDRDGFLLFPELVTSAEIAVLKTELQRLCLLRGAEVVREHNDTPRMVFRTHDMDSPTASAPFHAFSRLPRILRPAQQVLGDDALYIHHTKCNVKEAIDGTAYQWHQDYGYWKYDGIAQPNMATMMVMLEGATQMGGCLYFLPGSHKLGRVEPQWDDKTSSYGTWVVPKQAMLKAMARCPEPVAVTGAPGTAALFHCNLMHGSGHNLSKHARWHAYTAFNTVANHARSVYKPRPLWVRGGEFTPLQLVEDDAVVAGQASAHEAAE